MSGLIELEFETEWSPEIAKNVIKAAFKSNFGQNAKLTDLGFELEVILKGRQQTNHLQTVWKFNFKNEHFRLEITFFNSSGENFLLVSGDRPKIQLSILARMVNKKLVPNAGFFVDSATGILKFVFHENWKNFPQLIRDKVTAAAFINDVLNKLWTFSEILIFVDAGNTKVVEVDRKQKTVYDKINRLRVLLKGTKNNRKQILACFRDLVQSKQGSKKLNNQIMQTASLYLKNVVNFHKSTFGLQDLDIYDIDSERFNQQFKSEIYEIYKHNSKNKEDQSKLQTEKICLGLYKIINISDNPPDTVSMQGSHSVILKNQFRYGVVETIHVQTAEGIKKVRQVIKQTTGELVYKTCNMREQSINSFKNQLSVLKYLKERTSREIGKYFLQLKREQVWNQKDIIYMTKYVNNLYQFLQLNTKLGLRSRIELSYRISKGLSFLFRWKVVHRDFKPQNVLIDKNLSPKIIDFGSSVCHFGQQKQSFSVHDSRLLTTLGFNIQYFQFPPNHQIRQKYTKQQYDEHPLFDVYGFGRTLSFIFFGSLTPPYPPEEYLQDPYYDIYDNILFLIGMCLSLDPEDRPSFGEITLFLGALKLLLRNLEQQ